MRFDKKRFFAIHSWIGVQWSMLFFIVCFSGTLAVFSHELDWIFNPSMRAEPQESFASKNKILAQIKAQYPKASITYWERSREDYLADIIYLRKESGHQMYLFANPYTGKLQGAAKMTIQHFFRALHYYLFIPFQVGHFIVLTFAFLLLGSLISGWKFLSNKRKYLTQIKLQSNSLAFIKNFHKTFGLWAIPFIVLISATGIWYFAERTNMFSVRKYIRDIRLKKTEVVVKNDPNYAYHIDYDRCLKIAQQQIPGLKFGNFVIPKNKAYPLEVCGLSGVPLVRYRANRVVIDTDIYSVLQVQRAEETHFLKTINNIADPLHFGYFGGLISKVIWFFFGLLISFLVASGIWIYLRRMANRKNMRYGFRYQNWFLFGVIQFYMHYYLIDRYDLDMRNHLIITALWLCFVYAIYKFFFVPFRRVKQKNIN